MDDTQHGQAWRQRQREEGKTPVTVWLSREEKRRLEALARTWQCSATELVQLALEAFHPTSPPDIVAVPPLEQLRPFLTVIMTELVTARLPALVREMVGGLGSALAAQPASAPGRRRPATPPTVRPPSSAKTTVVTRLRALRAQGLSLGQITMQMRAAGVPTLSGRGTWQKGTVAKLLRA